MHPNWHHSTCKISHDSDNRTSNSVELCIHISFHSRIEASYFYWPVGARSACLSFLDGLDHAHTTSREWYVTGKRRMLQEIPKVTWIQIPSWQLLAESCFHCLWRILEPKWAASCCVRGGWVQTFQLSKMSREKLGSRVVSVRVQWCPQWACDLWILEPLLDPQHAPDRGMHQRENQEGAAGIRRPAKAWKRHEAYQ